MSSSNSYDDNQNRSLNPMFTQNLNTKRKKDYICPCGRPYGSYPALYAHIKRKHGGKAPGQIIKPKSVRRRGRPFKYILQTDNPHRSASKHLQDYLRKGPSQPDYQIRVSNGGDLNEYPLKQFADPNLKTTFPNFKTTLQESTHKKFTAENGSQEGKNLRVGLETSMPQYSLREERNQVPSNLLAPLNEQFHHYGTGNPMQHSQRMKNFPFEGRSGDYRFGVNDNFSMGSENAHNYKRLYKDKTNLTDQGLYSNDSLYNRFPFHQQPTLQNAFDKTYDDSIDALYFRPFEITLREQMELKFKPIAQGIIQFLEPILKELLQEQAVHSSQKPIIIEDHPSQKPAEKLHSQNNIQLGERAFENGSKMQHKQNQNKLSQMTVSALLQKQHFRDILKWLMTPPEEISIHRMKENYIQFNFRCCLVEFLDFLHNFLETVQYEQVLLILVFFCDHILAETGSFQIQPEPQIYEMGMYYNSFINEYLPKLGKFMPYLQKFYIFKEFKKKVSQTLMWMSSWQSIQQYYHNKFYRERVSYEIQQENYKCLMYQRKYQAYMRQALRGNSGGVPQRVNNQVEQIEQIQEGEEKAESNPEMIIVNTQQSLQSRRNINPTDRDEPQSSSGSEGRENHVNSLSSFNNNDSGQENQKSDLSPDLPQDESEKIGSEVNHRENEQISLSHSENNIEKS